MSWKQLQPLSRISRRSALGQSRSPLGTWTPAVVSSVAASKGSVPWVTPKPKLRKSLGFFKPPLIPVEAAAPPSTSRFISTPYPTTATVSRDDASEGGAIAPPSDASKITSTQPQLPVLPALQRQPLGPTKPPLVKPSTAQNDPESTKTDGNRSQDKVADGTNAAPPSELPESSPSSLLPQAATPPIQARQTSENRPISAPPEALSPASKDASPRVEPTAPTESPPVLQPHSDAAPPPTSELRQTISEPTSFPTTDAGETIQPTAAVPEETIQAAPVAPGETIQPPLAVPRESARPQPQSQTEPSLSPISTPIASPPESRVQAALELFQTAPTPATQPTEEPDPPTVQAFPDETWEDSTDSAVPSSDLPQPADGAIAPAIDITEPPSVQPTDPRLPTFPALQRRPLGPAKPPLVQLPAVQPFSDTETSDRKQDHRTKGADITAQPVESGIAAVEDTSSSPALPPPSAPPIQAQQTSADTAVPPSADSPPIQRTAALSRGVQPNQPDPASPASLQRRDDIVPLPDPNSRQAISTAPIAPATTEDSTLPIVSASPLAEPTTNQPLATQLPSVSSAPADIPNESIVPVAPQAPPTVSKNLPREDSASPVVQARTDGPTGDSTSPAVQARASNVVPLPASRSSQTLAEPPVFPSSDAEEAIEATAAVPEETIQAAPAAAVVSARQQPQPQTALPPSVPSLPSVPLSKSRVQAVPELPETAPASTAPPTNNAAPPAVQSLSEGISEALPEPTDLLGDLSPPADAAISPAIYTTEPPSVVQPTDSRLPAFPTLQRRPLGSAKPPLVQLPAVQRSAETGTSDPNRAPDNLTDSSDATAQLAPPGISAVEDTSSSFALPSPSAPLVQSRQTPVDSSVSPTTDSLSIQREAPPSQPEPEQPATVQRRSDLASPPDPSPSQVPSDIPLAPKIDENLATPAGSETSGVKPVTNRLPETPAPSTPSAPTELTRESFVQAAPQVSPMGATDASEEASTSPVIQMKPDATTGEKLASPLTPTSPTPTLPTLTNVPSDLAQAKDAIADPSQLTPSTLSPTDPQPPVLPTLQRQPLGHFSSLLPESPPLQSDVPEPVSDLTSAAVVQPLPAERMPTIPTAIPPKADVDASLPSETNDLPTIQPKRETAQAPNRQTTDRIQRLPAPTQESEGESLERQASAENAQEISALNQRPPLGQPLQRLTPPPVLPDSSPTPAITRKQSNRPRTQSLPAARSQPEAWKAQFALNKPQSSQAEPWQDQFALEPAGGPIAVQQFPQETAIARKEAPPADVIIPEKPVVRRLVNPLSQQEKPAPGESVSVDEAQLEQLARICYVLARSRLDLLRENQYGLVGDFPPWLDVSIPMSGSASGEAKAHNPPALTAALDATSLYQDRNIQALVEEVAVLLQQRLLIEQERMNLSCNTRF